jgi:hypothetical protein
MLSHWVTVLRHEGDGQGRFYIKGLGLRPGDVRAVSEANRRDRFGWLGPQGFAFDTAV